MQFAKCIPLVHCFWGRLIVNIGAEEKEGQFPWESFQERMSHLAPKPVAVVAVMYFTFVLISNLVNWYLYLITRNSKFERKHLQTCSFYLTHYMNHHIFSAIAHLNMYFSSCKKQSIAYSKLSLITITNNLIAINNKCRSTL